MLSLHVPWESIYSAAFCVAVVFLVFAFDPFSFKKKLIERDETAKGNNLKTFNVESFVLIVIFSILFIHLVSSQLSMGKEYYFFSLFYLVISLYFSWKWKNTDIFLFVFTLMVGGINYNAWYWAEVGDELPHIEAGLNFFFNFWDSPIHNLIDLQGVYGSHPKFSTLLHGIIGGLGVNNFIASRFSNVIFWAISTIFLRRILERFVSSYITFLVSLCFATSGFLLAFSKIGYNNLQAMVLHLWAFYVLLKCFENPNRGNYFYSGAVTGLLLYSFPPAIYFLPVSILSFFINRKFKLFINFISGWALISFPALLQMPKYVQELSEAGQIYNKGHSYMDFINSYASKIILMFAIPIHNIHHSHFIFSEIINPALGVLALIGLVYTIRKRNFFPGNYSLLIYFAIVGSACCLFNAYDGIPMTRVFLVLPALYILSAISLEKILSSNKKLLIIFTLFVISTNIYNGIYLQISPNNDSRRAYQDWRAQLVRFEQFHWKKDFSNLKRDNHIGYVVISKDLQIGGRAVDFLQKQFMPEMGFYFKFLTPEDDLKTIDDIVARGISPVFFISIDQNSEEYKTKFRVNNFAECSMKTLNLRIERLIAFLPPNNKAYHCPN